MLSQRLQILVSPEQRRRLETEAKRRGASVGSLVREAVDERYGGVSREDRKRALDRIKAMRGGGYISPEEINRIVEEEREANLGAKPLPPR